MRFRVANSRGVRQPVIQYVQSVWSTVRQFCFVRMLWGVGERILATWGVKRVEKGISRMGDNRDKNK